MAWVFIALVVAGAGGYLVWRYVDAVQSGRRRTRELAARVGPVLRQVEGDETPTDAILELATDPATRNLMRLGLESLERLYLFPAEFAGPEAVAESDFVVWLRHPRTLGGSPDEMVLAATVARPGPATDGEWHFFVFKFRANRPAWAARRGWMAGVAGPYGPRGAAIRDGGPSGTFSQFKPWETATVDDHVAFSYAMALRHRGFTAGQRAAPARRPSG